MRSHEFVRFREGRESTALAGSWRESDNLSGVSVGLDYDHIPAARRGHVLAVRRMRRSLECISAGGRVEPSTQMAVNARELSRELEELIEALDRRVPRVEQAGEIAIARDAAALRAKAVNRLSELATSPPVPDPRRRGEPV